MLQGEELDLLPPVSKLAGYSVGEAAGQGQLLAAGGQEQQQRMGPGEVVVRYMGAAVPAKPVAMPRCVSSRAYLRACMHVPLPTAASNL